PSSSQMTRIGSGIASACTRLAGRSPRGRAARKRGGSARALGRRGRPPPRGGGGGGKGGRPGGGAFPRPSFALGSPEQNRLPGAGSAAGVGVGAAKPWVGQQPPHLFVSGDQPRLVAGRGTDLVDRTLGLKRP